VSESKNWNWHQLVPSSLLGKILSFSKKLVVIVDLNRVARGLRRSPRQIARCGDKAGGAEGNLKPAYLLRSKLK
jgi:hypothetical protein